jgi:hypothetical protein
MNYRAFAAALYLVLFLVTLLNFAALSPTIFSEVSPLLFVGMIQALIGTLLALWIYQDDRNIQALRSEIAKLRDYLTEAQNTKK